MKPFDDLGFLPIPTTHNPISHQNTLEQSARNECLQANFEVMIKNIKEFVNNSTNEPKEVKQSQDIGVCLNLIKQTLTKDQIDGVLDLLVRWLKEVAKHKEKTIKYLSESTVSMYAAVVVEDLNLWKQDNLLDDLNLSFDNPAHETYFCNFSKLTAIADKVIEHCQRKAQFFKENPRIKRKTFRKIRELLQQEDFNTKLKSLNTDLMEVFNTLKDNFANFKLNFKENSRAIRVLKEFCKSKNSSKTKKNELLEELSEYEVIWAKGDPSNMLFDSKNLLRPNYLKKIVQTIESCPSSPQRAYKLFGLKIPHFFNRLDKDSEEKSHCCDKLPNSCRSNLAECTNLVKDLFIPVPDGKQDLPDYAGFKAKRPKSDKVCNKLKLLIENLSLLQNLVHYCNKNNRYRCTLFDIPDHLKEDFEVICHEILNNIEDLFKVTVKKLSSSLHTIRSSVNGFSIFIDSNPEDTNYETIFANAHKQSRAFNLPKITKDMKLMNPTIRRLKRFYIKLIKKKEETEDLIRQWSEKLYGLPICDLREITGTSLSEDGNLLKNLL